MSIDSQMIPSSVVDLDDYRFKEVSQNDITVVIPTLNEELAIGPVIEGLIDEGYSNILVVDGYSQDNTVNIAKNYGATVIQQNGKGKTGAIRTAIEQIETPYLVVIDGDLTYYPNDVRKFLIHIRHYDEIIGARNHGRDNISRLNRLGNYVINKTFNILFGTSLTDVCSGLYCLRTEFAKGLILNTGGFDVEVEIAAQAGSNGSITQVPINYGKRKGRRKLHPVKDGLRIYVTVWRLATAYNPTVLYSVFASLSMSPAFVILFWTLFESIQGKWHETTALLGTIMLLFGVQCIGLRNLSERQRRFERKVMDGLRGEIGGN